MKHERSAHPESRPSRRADPRLAIIDPDGDVVRGTGGPDRRSPPGPGYSGCGGIRAPMLPRRSAE